MTAASSEGQRTQRRRSHTYQLKNDSIYLKHNFGFNKQFYAHIVKSIENMFMPVSNAAHKKHDQRKKKLFSQTNKSHRMPTGS